ncbi:hypothetical protein [Leifsonia sp. NPDC058248]|uniref:hypothetical protein n=1 Tax=Leifsonia sp. NPDC058248 TaxID=3346402 RepID=UPI0036DF54BF
MSALTYATLGPVTFNAKDAAGVEWYLSNIAGWGAPQGTLKPVQKPRQAGAWAGLSYAQGRSLVVSGAVVAPTPELAVAALDNLISAVSLDDTLLTVYEPGGMIRTVTVRRDGDVLPVWESSVAFTFSAQVFAADPRKLGPVMSGSTGMPATSGGLIIPHTIPFAIASTVIAGQISMFNPGNEIGSVVLRIDGPCVGPVITHSSSTTRTALVFSSSLALGVGEWLTVDMDSHVTLGNDQANRASYITSRGWSGFDPGENTWAFTAPAFNPAALLTVTATPAWQ